MDVSQVNLNRLEAAHAQQATAFHNEAQSAGALAAQQAARNATRQVASAVQQLNKFDYAGDSRELTIVLDAKTRRPLVRIVDKETGEVVQQIPSEYVLRMAQEAKERLKQSTA